MGDEKIDHSYSWMDLGRALHAPLYVLKSEEDYLKDYQAAVQNPPDVVAIHGSPSREEELLRHDLAADHLLYLDETNSRFDPLVLEPEDVQQTVEKERESTLEDLGFEVQGYGLTKRGHEVDELVCTIDDYLGIEYHTSMRDKVDSSVSDYFKFRNEVAGSLLLEGREHEVYGVETDGIGRDSLAMRILEVGKTGVQMGAWQLFNKRLG